MTIRWVSLPHPRERLAGAESLAALGAAAEPGRRQARGPGRALGGRSFLLLFVFSSGVLRVYGGGGVRVFLCFFFPSFFFWGGSGGGVRFWLSFRGFAGLGGGGGGWGCFFCFLRGSAGLWGGGGGGVVSGWGLRWSLGVMLTPNLSRTPPRPSTRTPSPF